VKHSGEFSELGSLERRRGKRKRKKTERVEEEKKNFDQLHSFHSFLRIVLRENYFFFSCVIHERMF
jgi:hypothetical protein